MSSTPAGVSRQRGLPKPPARLSPFKVYTRALSSLVLAAREQAAVRPPMRHMANSLPSPGNPQGIGNPAYAPPSARVSNPRPRSSQGIFSLAKTPFSGFSSSSKDTLPREFYRQLRRRLEAVRLPANIGRLPVECKDHTIPEALARFGMEVMHEQRFKERSKSPGTMADLIAAFLEVIVVSGIRAPGAQTPYIKAFVFVTRECLFVDFTGQSFFASAIQDLKRVEELMSGTGTGSSPGGAGGGALRRSSFQHPLPDTPSLSPSMDLPPFSDESGQCERLRAVMGISPEMHREVLGAVVERATKEYAFQDLKNCIKALAQDNHPVLTPKDFPSREDYLVWKGKEMTILEQLLIGMNIQSPELPGGRTLDQGGQQAPFTYEFIPQNPKAAFQILVQHFVKADLDQGDDGDDASFSSDSEGKEGGRRKGPEWISKSSLLILRECGSRWRLGQTYRFLCILEAIGVLYEERKVDIASVEHALAHTQKSLRSVDGGEWFPGDRKYVLQVYSSLNRSLVHQLAEELSDFDKKTQEHIDPYLAILEDIHHDEFFQEFSTDMETSAEEIISAIQSAAISRFNRTYHQEGAILPDGSKPDEIVTMWTTAESIIEDTKKTGRRFPSLILGTVDVAGVALSAYLKFYVLEMENVVQSPVMIRAAETEGRSAEVVFRLYDGARSLQLMHRRSGLKMEVSFDLARWFYPHVMRWLKLTDGLTNQWVANAIRLDKYEPVSVETKYSSSVLDLFTVVQQQITFLDNLDWPNEIHSAQFITHLGKTIGAAMEKYCEAMEGLFRKEIYGVEEEGGGGEGGGGGGAAGPPAKQMSWFERARAATLRPKREMAAVNLRVETCIKLNNVEAVQQHLDELYTTLEVEKVAALLCEGPESPTTARPILRKFPNPLEASGSSSNGDLGGLVFAPPPPETGVTHLYTVKVALGEEIKPLDRNGLSDPYVVLDVEGDELVRTRVIYETCNPRFDETFDLKFYYPVSVNLTVYDRDMIGADRVCGRGRFDLKPGLFDDYMSHDVWVELDTQGRILLRVSMEGERDDVRFYFGKAFRHLRRTQADMARMIIEQMSGYIKQCLSKKMLFQTLQNIGKISYFGDGGGERNGVRGRMATEKECDDALGPLYDYLDRNMSLLYQHLRGEVAKMVLGRLWKEILRTMEDHLAPPLSAQPSNQKPLTAQELGMILSCLELMKSYFAGGDSGDGMEGAALEAGRWGVIRELGRMYGLSTDEILLEYGRAAARGEDETFRKGRKAARSKSIMQRRNLKKIRSLEQDKRNGGVDVAACALRLLRMRKEAHLFVKEQVEQRGERPGYMQNKALPPSPKVLVISSAGGIGRA